MKTPRPWLVVSGALALGVGAAIGGSAIALNDSPAQALGDGVSLSADADPAVDDSPESADSPFESAEDSIDSPYAFNVNCASSGISTMVPRNGTSGFPTSAVEP